MDWYALITDDGKWTRVWWLDQSMNSQVAAEKGLQELARKTLPPFSPLTKGFVISIAPLDCLCAPSSDDETLPALFRLRLNRDVVINRDGGPWKVSTIEQFLSEWPCADWIGHPPKPTNLVQQTDRIKHYHRLGVAAWELWRVAAWELWRESNKGDQS